MGWGQGMSVHPARAPQPMWFWQQYGVWGNGPQNKDGVCGGESGREKRGAEALGSGEGRARRGQYWERRR